ncbi:MAG: serine/threonine-protein kinase, partial [Chloroflexota bacterium]
VALKVLRGDVVDDESFLVRFRREAQAIAALRHPNIVQVFDFDVQDDVNGLGITFMVMELLEGDTLKARLNDYRTRDEPMPLGEIVRILLDILDGLSYAHSESMIHRDIKPANIMLTKRGQAVITDFGIAQIVGGTQHTASGILMGTLNYMAPEQGLEGKSDVRSDLYSLGIVFYELLTQQTPFDADTPLAILMKHLNDPLPMPHNVTTAIPTPLEGVLLKALAKEPEARFQTADEMAQALHQAAIEAELEIPETISLPLSFTTDEDPSESVAVFSGSIRGKIQDVGFTDDDTQMTSEGLLLDEIRAAQPVVAPPKPLQRGGFLRLPRLAHLSKRLYPLTRIEPINETEEKLRSFLRIPIVPLALIPLNLVLVLFAGITGLWDVYEQGWPAQILFASLIFPALMVKNDKFSYLIPNGILMGMATLLGYYAISDNWDDWEFLWPLVPLIVLSSVFGSLYLRREMSQTGLARTIGYLTARYAVIVGFLIMILSIPL